MDKNPQEGISQEVNARGQLEVTVDVYEDEWNKQYNGKYIFDRVKFGHRKLIFKAQKAMSGMGESVDEVISEIAKERKVQFKHVRDMVENGGEELSDEEAKRINACSESTIDTEKMLDIAPALFKELMVEAPIDLSVEEKLEDIDMGFIILLFTTCATWSFKSLKVPEKRRKK